MNSNKIHEIAPTIQTAQDEYDIAKDSLQFDDISSLSTNYSVFSDFYTECTNNVHTIPGIAECPSTESSKSNCTISSSLSSASEASKKMEMIDASPILVIRDGKDTVDFNMKNKTPYTQIKVDTKLSPGLPFALISPSPMATDARYPAIEVSQSIETRSQNEENSFPFFSTFSSPMQSPPNLISTNAPAHVPKQVQNVISKLVQSNHELNQQVSALQQTPSQDETHTHDNYSFGKELNNQNQITVLYSSSNDVATANHKSHTRSVSPLPILHPHLDMNVGISAHSMGCSTKKNVNHHIEDQMRVHIEKDPINGFEHQQKETGNGETASFILMANILKQKDLHIHALESKIEKLQTEFMEQLEKWREEKERMEIETTNTINEIRLGSLTVLMNTKQHVHDLLIEVEEYKLRCAKLGVSERNCKNMCEATVILIDSEKDNTTLFGDTNKKYSTEIKEEFGVVHEVEEKELDINPLDANATNIQKLNKKIQTMELEIKILRKQKGLRQDGLTVPNFDNFDSKDTVIFEGRDDSQFPQMKREEPEICVTEFIRESSESRIQCVQTENNLSLFTTHSDNELFNLRQECNKYKQEAMLSKLQVSELMEENMECLERLACVGTELLVHGIGKGRKKTRRKQMMAVAKAAGDLESIRKAKQMDDTDSLMNHTGYSECGSDSSHKDNALIKFKFKAQYKIPEIKEDACEIDPLLRRDQSCNRVKKDLHPQKKKYLKISLRNKLKHRKK